MEQLIRSSSAQRKKALRSSQQFKGLTGAEQADTVLQETFRALEKALDSGEYSLYLRYNKEKLTSKKGECIGIYDRNLLQVKSSALYRIYRCYAEYPLTCQNWRKIMLDSSLRIMEKAIHGIRHFEIVRSLVNIKSA